MSRLLFYSSSSYSLLLLLLSSAVVHAAVITIDLQRNVWGTTNNVLKAFDNVDNSVYFQATNADDVAAWHFVDQASHPLQSVSIDHVLNMDASVKLIVATLKPNGSHAYQLDAVNGDGTVLGSLVFTIEAPSNPQIVSCSNDRAKLYVPESYNLTYLALNGQEGTPACSFQIVLSGEAPTSPHNVEVPMTTCGLSYYNQFQVSLREHEAFNVDGDFNALMTCSKIKLVTTLSTQTQGDYGVPESDTLFEQGVLGSMYVHARDDPQTALTDSVPVGTPATLRVSLGELYKFNFDILPLICSVNDVLITSSSCSTNTAIFGEFTKHGIGELSADFDMFRVVDPTTNVPSTSITIQCTFYVATVDTSTGTSLAPVSPCITY